MIEAGTKAASWYTGEAGIAAGTLMIVCALLIALLVAMYRTFTSRLEKRDVEIADLRVACAKEIAQAKLDAQEAAEERFRMAWQRVGEIFESTKVLFASCAQSNQQVSTSLKNLQITLATKGIISSD